jgi:hypothetical protein
MTYLERFFSLRRFPCTRLREMIWAFGMNPEQILTKEAISMPNRTVIMVGNEPSEGQMDTLLKALRQKLKEELFEKPIVTSKTV